MRRYSPPLCVPALRVYVCVRLSAMHACVLSLFCVNVRCLRVLRALTCGVACAARVKAALCLDKRSKSLSHTHTHTSDPQSSLLHSVLKGSVLMTVNSPDNSALSIFRQYCSVVK